MLGEQETGCYTAGGGFWRGLNKYLLKETPPGSLHHKRKTEKPGKLEYCCLAPAMGHHFRLQVENWVNTLGSLARFNFSWGAGMPPAKVNKYE